MLFCIPLWALLLPSSLPTISSLCHSICSALLPSASTLQHRPAPGLPTLPSSTLPAHETTGVWTHQGCEPNTTRGAVDDFSSPPLCPTASFHRPCAGSDDHHVLLALACEGRALAGSRFPEEFNTGKIHPAPGKGHHFSQPGCSRD